MSDLDHARYEELVVGHALSALEPEDEQVLVRHLASCAACERDLAVHRETLAHLAYAADEGSPPPQLWDGIRDEVSRPGRPLSFSGDAQLLPPVADLEQARARRRTRAAARRGAAWIGAAAAIALVATLGAQVVRLQHDRDQQSALAQRLAAAVRTVETAPARTVPLTDKTGKVYGVAVMAGDRLSLVVDGLARNDPRSSTYVLWGATGREQAKALASFDVPDDAVAVVRDVALPASPAARPDLLLLTREPGRTAPAVTQQPALATGRSA